MRYPVVFFDADDTLFDFEKTKQVALDALFVEAGFRINQIQPIDMFPQTYHTECIVTMQIKDSNI